MENNIKIMLNGREIELPFNINELFSQLNQQEDIPGPHPSFPKPTPLFPTPRPSAIQTKQIVRRITLCKDVPVRNVVMELSQRIAKLEELLNVKASTELEESLKTPFVKKGIPTKKKIISKTKEIPKTKGKSKANLKSKKKTKVIKKKKIGKKK